MSLISFEDLCAVTKIQSELKAPKKSANNLGNYNYRSWQDILKH